MMQFLVIYQNGYLERVKVNTWDELLEWLRRHPTDLNAAVQTIARVG